MCTMNKSNGLIIPAALAAVFAFVAPSKETSASSISLDGEWDFKYFADARNWETWNREYGTEKIAVPSNWELKGFGKFSYGSEKGDPSEESGVYHRTFATPEEFKDGAVALLRFEGVMFGAEVEVNGKKVGGFSSSFNRNTLDVSRFLRNDGKENELVVHTLIKPKGCAFDTNDDWTLHGIFRSVFLDIRPAVHLKDWTLSVKNGKVSVKTELAGEGTLEHNLPERVSPEQLWSAENPVLHEAVFTVKDASGRVTEVIKEKVGFREITWSGRELKVNGKRVWLKGVNHHDLCPCHGRAITDKEQWQDVKMIKDAGMNFIRCCHYPPSTALLDACDALGVYVLDEVPFGFGDKYLYDASNEDVLCERVRLTLARDKNRASVLAWSVGNENPVTPITIAAGRLTGELDPTRPWTFPMIPGVFQKWVDGESDLALANRDIPLIYDWHYPNDQNIPDFTNKVDRPIIASEWGHAFGSDSGDIAKIYKAMQNWREFHGGAIWMFQDQGVERKAADVGDKERLESAWKDEETIWDAHGLAGTDGLVYSDRTPQTDWFQVLAIFNGKKQVRSEELGIRSSSEVSSPTPNSPTPNSSLLTPNFSLRFDRRMTVTKRNTMKSGEDSRKKRDAALAKGKNWTKGRKQADIKDLVLPRIQPANDDDIKVVEKDGVYEVKYALWRDVAWDSAEAGICFELPDDITEFRWQGMGPYEMYPQRGELDDFGVWHFNREDLYFPGNRSGVTAAIVCDKSGAGWIILPAKEGERLNIAVENTASGAMRLCINQFVCGIYHKRGWPDDMRHVEAGEKIEGAFRLAPLAADWPEELRKVFGASDARVKVTKPFLRSYDQGAGE